ncbi:MAG: hypothetical protein J6Q44_02030 [Alphaproteobacteria bacterium]|nr:hypothetical protein [Alphaproteobacteria bacterium]
MMHRLGLSLVLGCSALFLGTCFAADCVAYKKIPAVYINTPDWSKTIVQPRKEMDLLHGNVVATMVDNYQINADVVPVDGGFCVGLKSVNAIVGYNDFVVNIDMRHIPESCEYNAVLAHEDKHIKTYLSVIDDFKGELQKSIYSAAQSVMPRFVKNRHLVDGVIEKMNDELQSHPDVVLVKQKIFADVEIRNKQIDRAESGDELKKCK